MATALPPSDGLPWAPLPSESWLQPPKWVFRELALVMLAIHLALCFGVALWLSPRVLGIPSGSRAELELLIAVALAIPILFGGASEWLKRDLNRVWDLYNARLVEGDLAGALEALNRCARHNRVPMSHARTLYALALLSLRMGDIGRARSVLASLERHRGRDPAGLTAAVVGLAALVEALEGDSVKSRAFIVAARQREEAGGDVRVCLAVLAELVLFARVERWPDCDGISFSFEDHADPEAWDHTTEKMHYLLYAFIQVRSGSNPDAVHWFDDQPHLTRGIEQMWRSWPALAAFVANLSGTKELKN